MPSLTMPSESRFADSARRFEYGIRHAQFFVHVTNSVLSLRRAAMSDKTLLIYAAELRRLADCPLYRRPPGRFNRREP